MKTINVYTDGGCNKVNTGALAFYIPDEDKNIMYARRYENTTNNEMELGAILTVLNYFMIMQIKPSIITIYSDSQYSIGALTTWKKNWINNNFKGSTGKTIKNLKLIQQIYAVQNYLENACRCEIHYIHVKGHNGNEGNEMADSLCTNTINEKERRGFSANMPDLLEVSISKVIDDLINTHNRIKKKIDSKVSNDVLTYHDNKKSTNKTYRIIEMPDALKERTGEWIIFKGFPCKLIEI